MGWIRLDDAIADHPKIVSAGPAAAWLYISGLTYAARLRTDGFIPSAQVARLTTLSKPNPLAQRLVEVRLWEQVEGGFQIHGYEEWQTDAATIEAKRRADAERKRNGFRKDSKRNPEGFPSDSKRRREVEVEEKRIPPNPPDATSPTTSADDVAGGNENGHAGVSNVLGGELCEASKRRVAEAKAALMAGQKI